MTSKEGINLTLCCRRYDLTQPLIDGLVKPQGIDLTWKPLVDYGEDFIKMARGSSHDIFEFSLASYVVAKFQERPVTAIPVFPMRLFRHSYIFCNVDSAIAEPLDLVGKKVGVQGFTVTAVVWLKGILQHEYGVPLEKIRWFIEREERFPIDYPRDAEIQKLPRGASLDDLLERGELDAVLSPRVIQPFQAGSKKIRRLFEDPFTVEVQYYRKTGIFPIMHTVVVRNGVLKEHPQVATALLEAFERAKRQAYGTLLDPNANAYCLAWLRTVAEEQFKTLGADPYPYNLRDNRKAIETLSQYCSEQGLTKRMLSVEELFPTVS